jgi:hypothetical protein
VKADEISNVLDVVAGLLLRCFLLSVALLAIWFLFYLAGGDWAYSVHSKWFDLSRHEFALLNYYGMAFLKLGAIVFFLLPYCAIKLMLRKRD